MALQRQVNGVKVEIDSVEETTIQANWQKNNIKKEQENSELDAKKTARNAVLVKLDLTEEEAALLKMDV